jgi:hypothetical protein
MSKLTNALRLVRNLRKGKHEKFAIQKALASIRSIESSAQHRIQSESDLAGWQESHGEIDVGQTHIQDIRVRDQG